LILISPVTAFGESDKEGAGKEVLSSFAILYFGHLQLTRFPQALLTHCFLRSHKALGSGNYQHAVCFSLVKACSEKPCYCREGLEMEARPADT